jgi:hypothetical protein
LHASVNHDVFPLQLFTCFILQSDDKQIDIYLPFPVASKHTHATSSLVEGLCWNTTRITGFVKPAQFPLTAIGTQSNSVCLFGSLLDGITMATTAVFVVRRFAKLV